MRIALVSNNYTPYSGGVVSALNVLASSLINCGHSVCLIVPDFGVVLQEKDPDYVVRLPCPITFNYKKKPIALSWSYRRDVLDIIRTFNVDIVHVHHPFLLGVAGRNAARYLEKPVIFTYHTCYEEYTHYVPLPEITSRYTVTKIVKRFCASVDGIIVPSSTILNQVRKKNKDLVIQKIPTAIQKIFLESNKNIRTRTKEDPFFLLYVGRFTHEKNVEILLWILTQLDKRFCLQLVGYGDLYEKLRNLAYGFFLLSPDRVQFFHSPSHSEIARFYYDADLFLFPSCSDTQGLVLAEAMAGSSPVVALDGPGQRDIICGGYNGYITYSKQEMVAKINQIADNPDHHVSLQHGAWDTSRAYHSGNYIDKTINFYKRIISDQ